MSHDKENETIDDEEPIIYNRYRDPIYEEYKTQRSIEKFVSLIRSMKLNQNIKKIFGFDITEFITYANFDHLRQNRYVLKNELLRKLSFANVKSHNEILKRIEHNRNKDKYSLFHKLEDPSFYLKLAEHYPHLFLENEELMNIMRDHFYPLIIHSEIDRKKHNCSFEFDIKIDNYENMTNEELLDGFKRWLYTYAYISLDVGKMWANGRGIFETTLKHIKETLVREAKEELEKLEK